ncbi:M23 family metallopeptidase [Natrialba aegyptia]|uniref:Peptidase M23 n=1 Tax=Natrialba aegyptia DSM 13077 TaxID=1227491 RepID=M0B990_9EURY|nr:M23 family metallopeptidase [Natrialba aegyptia]ELZ06873.1 peptidase M23 [Natrialba aegyptia DSM 13077]
MAIRHPVDSDAGADPGRLRAITRRLPDPITVSLLGFLSIPGYVFDSLEELKLFALFFLAAFWPILQLIPGLLTGAGSDSDGDRTDPAPRDWLETDDRGTSIRMIVAMLLIQFQPVLLVTGIGQMAGQLPVLARYRGSLPSPADHESEVDYRLPFEGTWTVINGSPDREYSHSWGLYAQRYAYDFVIADEDGRTTAGDRGPPDEFYCFGEPILAPADGTVVSVRTDHRDYHRTDGWLDPLQRSILGNNVIIEHAGGEFSVLAHLQRGSVAVEPGERVDRGQRIARCGHSGNSTEPHLHFHVQDRPNFFLGAGLPVQFDNVRTAHPDTESRSHERGYVHAGQRVTPLGDENEPAE